jgi:hypothetical protein
VAGANPGEQSLRTLYKIAEATFRFVTPVAGMGGSMLVILFGVYRLSAPVDDQGLEVWIIIVGIVGAALSAGLLVFANRKLSTRQWRELERHFEEAPTESEEPR